MSKHDFSSVDTWTLSRETRARANDVYEAIDVSWGKFLVAMMTLWIPSAVIIGVSSAIGVGHDVWFPVAVLATIVIAPFGIVPWLVALRTVRDLGNEMEARGNELRRRSAPR